ncbi:MAG: hypothetical protein LC791_16280 [Acidobacteria bacterium]|nr:hypothetical protein [Acidobacteriota bacterium]
MLVMRHAGVCIPRQYAHFAGVAYGAKCNAFFERLVRRGFAHAIDCIHNRARLYHVQSKALYYVIGGAGSRYRRPVSPRLAIERLMLLDAVLTTPDFEWITTAAEKSAYLTRLTASAPGATKQTSPAEGESTRTLALPGTLPIGVESDGRTVLLYLATEVSTDTFRTFLQGHAALLRVASTWTLRTIFPRPLDRVYDAYQTVIHEELESPLQPATIDELKWYFEHRDKATREPVHPQDQRFVDVGGNVFGTPRFTALYERWLKRGDAVFDGRSSPIIAEALNTGAGRVESFVLPHSYRHLSPLVDQRRSRGADAEKGVEKGAARGDVTSARSQPPVSTPWSPRERSIVM